VALIPATDAKLLELFLHRLREHQVLELSSAELEANGVAPTQLLPADDLLISGRFFFVTGVM
jgi:hypothetical protein